VGVSLNTGNITDLEAIIPNSHLIITPPYPTSGIAATDKAPQNRPAEWKTELYLQPGDWVPYVAAAVLGTVIILAGIVLGLNEQEKVSIFQSVYSIQSPDIS
jgi:integrin alpha FG-GAP repeat containing protein 1